jgi:hypothetical protein
MQNAKGGSGKLFGGSSGKQASAATGAGMANLEAGNGGPPAKESFLAAFFKDVEQVKKDIQAIKEAIREMNSIQSKSLVAQNAQEAALSIALQAVIHETNPKAACAKTLSKLCGRTPTSWPRPRAGRRLSTGFVRICLTP